MEIVTLCLKNIADLTVYLIVLIETLYDIGSSTPVLKTNPYK